MTSTDRRTRFDRLFEEHFRALLGYAWRRLDDVPRDPDARLWLFGVARRALSNQRRGDRRRDALAERLRATIDELPGARHEDDYDAALVSEAMGRLKARDREVLCLVCWEGLDPSKAAAVVEIPPATARTRLHRARQRMRKELTALGWEPMPALAAAGAPTAVLPLEERS